MRTLTAPAAVARPCRETGAGAEVGRPPLRVCFLIDFLARAGTETQLLALIRNLDRRKVRPYLCLLRGHVPGSQALEPDDCPVLRLNVRSLAKPWTLAEAWRFVRWLRRERIDVVQTYFPDSNYFGIPLAWLAGVPHRLRTRNNLGHWLTPLHRRLGRLLGRLSTATLTNCAAARDLLCREEGLPPGRVVVLENGVDLDRFLALPPIGAAEAGPVRRVGVVANLRHVKGLDVLARAAALLAEDHPGLVFEVAGEGEARPDLERLVRGLGLAGRFLLPGRLADIPRFLGSLDVAVLCSRAEGMSNALLEYLAAGRPVVATSVGAAGDLIEDGRHGLLVPAEDPAALAQAIARLLGDPDLARRLGSAARGRAQEGYSRQAMMRRFEAFYGSLAPRGT
jgi:glycosyltransferase involved in cell wall biosynthesis